MRWTVLPAAALAALALAGPAAARSFTVTAAGNSPDVAVDGGGTAHVVWDSVDPVTRTSTTHYCRIPRTAGACAPGSERAFTPIAGDRDFAGPHVFLPGGGRVVVLTTRCCTSEPGPDGEFHGRHLYALTSGDAGGTFDGGRWIGSQAPDLGAAFGPGDTIFSMGTAAGGVGIDAAPLGGFAGAPAIVSPVLALYGGVGVSGSTVLAGFADRSSMYVARLGAAGWATQRIGTGVDVHMTSGPKGPDLFSKGRGTRSRYTVRRWSAARGRFGQAVAVSERGGYPIFGNAAQDPRGRIHAVWVGLPGLTYRVSSPSGRDFRRPRLLARRSAGRWFDLVVAADARARAVVVYDSNDVAGKVGGYTVG